MNLLIHLIERVRLVIGRIGATLVVADGHAVVMGRREFAAQPNIIDARRRVAGPEIAGKVQRQMMHASKVHHFRRVLQTAVNVAMQLELLVGLQLAIVERHRGPVLESDGREREG